MIIARPEGGILSMFSDYTIIDQGSTSSSGGT
jgi:hypothetical protein